MDGSKIRQAVERLEHLPTIAPGVTPRTDSAVGLRKATSVTHEQWRARFGILWPVGAWMLVSIAPPQPAGVTSSTAEAVVGLLTLTFLGLAFATAGYALASSSWTAKMAFAAGCTGLAAVVACALALHVPVTSGVWLTQFAIAGTMTAFAARVALSRAG
ncbi:MAG: hypothetical protein KatS3mg008_1656 [Acidimicrobiales bacterium]|nr:MAG: hypothetical protein KatS3mg008_1656 [Acidimicrobiales bacterium]